MGTRSARGFNRSLHVSTDKLTADRGPIYIGQTLIDVPATVIAQQSGDGSIHVLAAFASEGMGLRRHIETVVKPWFVAHARFALHGQIFGTFEKIDGRTEWEMIQTVEDILGGSWETASAEWEIRRDAVLGLIGKATPGMFRPALQIDPEARLLIEALSGRWSYEKDRREKRSAWFYTANAFSLLVSSIQPQGKPDDIRVISNWDHTRNRPRV
jgi:hypothetical protein